MKITLTEKQDVKKENDKPLVIEEIASNGYKISKTFNKTFVNIVPNLTTDPKANFEKTQSSFTCSNQQWKHQKKVRHFCKVNNKDTRTTSMIFKQNSNIVVIFSLLTLDK